MDFEKIDYSRFLWRVIGFTVGGILIIAIGLIIYFFTGQTEPADRVEFGLTFSQLFAEEMGLDWHKAYLAMLDDLGVKKLRLVAYWPKIEPNQDQFDFADLDWQINEAAHRDVDVILAIGRKLPRWPECHIPEWADALDESAQQERIRIMLTQVVEHYQDAAAVKVWQVENEPFLKTFGTCPALDVEFLEEEIALVKRLDDQARPILLTASGELSSWTKPASRADIFGTTLYRTVHSETWGQLTYPIPPVFYYKRAKFVRWLTGVDKMVVIELQGEPWGPKQIYETPVNVQALSMDLELFREIIDYVRQTGFDEVYVWGVEWWYQKMAAGNGAMWAEAKKLWD